MGEFGLSRRGHAGRGPDGHGERAGHGQRPIGDEVAAFAQPGLVHHLELLARAEGEVDPARHPCAVQAQVERLRRRCLQQLAAKLREAGVEFLIEPYVRFEGEPGEQGTFFVKDPSGNALEFKTFRSDDDIFRR